MVLYSSNITLVVSVVIIKLFSVFQGTGGTRVRTTVRMLGERFVTLRNWFDRLLEGRMLAKPECSPGDLSMLDLAEMGRP